MRYTMGAQALVSYQLLGSGWCQTEVRSEVDEVTTKALSALQPRPPSVTRPPMAQALLPGRVGVDLGILPR